MVNCTVKTREHGTAAVNMIYLLNKLETPAALGGFSSATWVHLSHVQINWTEEEDQRTNCIKWAPWQNTRPVLWLRLRGGHLLCCQTLYTHNCSQKHTHASICTRVYTHMHKHGGSNSTSCQLLSQRNACTSFPSPEFLFTVKNKEEQTLLEFHILCISSLSLSFFLFFFHRWLCPNLETSEGWLSCIWIAQCLTTGLQILIVALEIA